MKPALWFVAALFGIVAVAWLVSRITGARAQWLDDWKFADGESILWRDDAADVYLIPRLGQAQVMSFARLRRHTVIVTNKQILVATRPLLGKKKMMQYVLRLSGGENSDRLDGGLFKAGFQTIVVEPKLDAHLDDQKPHLDLAPAAGNSSSVNLDKIRVFTDQGASFRLP